MVAGTCFNASLLPTKKCNIAGDNKPFFFLQSNWSSVSAIMINVSNDAAHINYSIALLRTE